MTNDPRAVIAAAPMHRLQIMVVAICIALNALDGFDVLAISFAAPGIADEWGVDKATLGIVLSMALLGMAAGSVMIGNLADRIGRRPTILSCLVVLALRAAERRVGTECVRPCRSRGCLDHYKKKTQ